MHPLTPRKPTSAANCYGSAMFALTFIIAIFVLFDLAPPIAWVQSADAPRAADFSFWTEFARDIFDIAIRPKTFSALVDQDLELHLTVIRAIGAFDLWPSLALRLPAAFIAAMIMASTARQIVLAQKFAMPAVGHVRGQKLLIGAAAIQSLRRKWTSRFGDTSPGVALTDGLAMPRNLEAEHILVVGGTGAGKTTILQYIMDGALKLGDRILALDVKGDVTARLPSESFSLLSLDDLRSARWELGQDICNKEDAEELAIELINETRDPSWSAGARRVLTGLLCAIIAQNRTSSWSWVDLADLLLEPIDELHRILLRHDPIAAEFIDISREETRKAALSFYLVLIANSGQAVAACAKLGEGSDRSVSVRKWMNGDGEQVLILRQSQRRPQLSAAMVRMVLKIAADAVADLGESEMTTATWFVLDELAQIGKSSAVPRLASIGRSAGVRIVAAIQSPAQIRDEYGHDTAQGLLDNLTTKIVGRVAAGKTAGEISSEWIGDRTVDYWEDGEPGSDGKARRYRQVRELPVVEPYQLSDDLGLRNAMMGRASIRAIVMGHGDIAMLEWPVGQWARRRPASLARKESSPIV